MNQPAEATSRPEPDTQKGAPGCCIIGAIVTATLGLLGVCISIFLIQFVYAKAYISYAAPLHQGQGNNALAAGNRAHTLLVL